MAAAFCAALGLGLEDGVVSWGAKWRRTKASLEVEARHTRRLQRAFEAIVDAFEVQEVALPGAVEVVRKYAPGALLRRDMEDLDAMEEIVRAAREGREDFSERLISCRAAAIWAAKQGYTPVSLARAACDARRVI